MKRYSLAGLEKLLQPPTVFRNIWAINVPNRVEQSDSFGQNRGNILAALGRQRTKSRVRFAVDVQSTPNEIHGIDACCIAFRSSPSHTHLIAYLRRSSNL